MTLRLLFGLLLAAASTSSCAEQEEVDVPHSGELQTATAKPEDRFGKRFADKFRADPNSEPTQPDDDDVPPVSLTTEPVLIE